MINFLFVLLISIMYACNNHSNVIKQSAPNYSFKINTGKVSDLNLQSIASFDGIIPLETKEECLIRSIGKVFVIDSSLVVWDKGGDNIFIFDNAGRYQRSIGGKGSSSEEYINIGDVQVSGDTIQVLDVPTRRIVKYNITGKFISSNQSDYYLYSFYEVSEGCWGINMYQNEDHYNLILLDKNLQKIKRGCFARDQILPLRSTNNFSKNEKSDELLFHYPYNDTIYKIREDSILPFIAFDFGNIEKLEEINTESYRGRIHNVHLFGDHLFFSFSCAYGNERPYEGYNCYISLKNSEVIVYTFNIIHDEKTIVSPSPEIINITKGKLIFQIVPGKLPEKVFDRLKDTSFGTVNSESNPILVLYNLKE